MTYTMVVAGGKSNVVAPNGIRYNTGATIVLADAEYAQLSRTALADFTGITYLGDQVTYQGTLKSSLTSSVVLPNGIKYPPGATNVVLSDAEYSQLSPTAAAGLFTSIGAVAATATPAAGSLTGWLKTTAALTPSATLNTYGTASTLLPDTGFSGFLVAQGSYASTGVATETVTLQALVTYSDNTTNTQALVSITSNLTTSFALGQLQTMLTGTDTRYVKSIAFNVKSSIASSAASVTVTLSGMNMP